MYFVENCLTKGSCYFSTLFSTNGFPLCWVMFPQTQPKNARKFPLTPVGARFTIYLKLRHILNFRKATFDFVLKQHFTSCHHVSGYQSGVSVRISDVFQVAARHYIRTLEPQGVFSRSSR